MTIQEPTFKRLFVDELHTSVTQVLRPARQLTIERIQPHLFIQGTPTGTVKFRIFKGTSTVDLVAEQSLDLTDAITQAGKTKTYYHGYISFVFDSPPILAAGTYTLQLFADSYTFDTETFIGWVMLPSDPSQTDPNTYPHDIAVVEIRGQ
jgi:hypothetical protein